jgi:predicted nucleotidyltransferase
MTLAAEITRDELVSGLIKLETNLRDCGVNRLAIFGSRARGDHQRESDLDVLIDVYPDQKFSLLDLVGVAHVIEDSLGVSANIFMRRSLEPQMAETIRSDIVEVF